MSRKNRKKFHSSPIYGFALTWAALSFLFPVFKLGGLVLTVAISSLVSYLLGRRAAKKDIEEELEEEKAEEAAVKEKTEKPAPEVKKSYGPEIDPIIEESNRALSEMGRLYMSIKDPDIRKKINDVMHITDKMAQDAINDPSDIPQIKKFFSYYLPTTIKLLNSYDRMSSQGITGENLDKSMKNINEMLDAAIAAYRKRLDDLFADQALDIETDIDVMNTMLAREGLSGGSDFDTK